MSLYTAISSIQKAVREIPDINTGGCGVFALAVARRLRGTALDWKIRVANPVWSTGGGEDLKKIINNGDVRNLLDSNGMGVWFGHVFLEVETPQGRLAFDSTKILPPDEFLNHLNFFAYDDALPMEDLEKLVMDPAGWNARFDRNHIPSLFERVNEAFSFA